MSQRKTLSLGKSGDSERSSIRPEEATKKVANFVESVNASGSNCAAREVNTKNAFGPSLADFTSQVSPSSSWAESGPSSGKQTVLKIEKHTGGRSQTESGSHTESGRLSESERQAKKEAFWTFNPTNAGNTLREQLREQEEEKEKERKRKRTKGQNKALGAFMKTTEPKNQSKEWLERSLRSENACPFCNRCAMPQ